ncbi:SAV_915 family protein [Streptomyces mirabilis]|uniref:SAV_915 family protein n=1 Tax=Streptomyces mirabilis TaxID=68239 RepID=UPI0036EEE628
MGAPIRSRISDYAETGPPDPSATAEPPDPEPRPSDPEPPASNPEPRRSRLLDYAEAEPPVRPDAEGRQGPKPGVPAYHTPVLVPAHPRYVDALDPSGRPTRVSFIAYELFEHPTDGTVAFAFTTPARLVAALGEAQPWVVTSIGPLAEGVREHGGTVCVDPRVAPGHHNWQPADLAAYAQEVR